MKIELIEKMQYPCIIKNYFVLSSINFIKYTKIINNIIVFYILAKYYKK
jgi:D-alanine-D-alanine ligase-like ATP-grasp enzyme